MVSGWRFPVLPGDAKNWTWDPFICWHTKGLPKSMSSEPAERRLLHCLIQILLLFVNTEVCNGVAAIIYSLLITYQLCLSASEIPLLLDSARRMKALRILTTGFNPSGSLMRSPKKVFSMEWIWDNDSTDVLCNKNVSIWIKVLPLDFMLCFTQMQPIQNAGLPYVLPCVL